VRSGIGLRAYGGADPVVVFKREARDMWDQLLDSIRHTIARNILNVTVTRQQPAQRPVIPTANGDSANLQAVKEAGSATSNADESDAPVRAGAGVQSREVRTDGRPAKVQTVVAGPKVGRNDPCPCGSGRKYKKCHGAAGL
jgi:preprotein translocase subunit SecA